MQSSIGNSKGPLRPSRPLFFEAGQAARSTQNGGSSNTMTIIIQLPPKFSRLLFVVRASDVVLPIFDTLDNFCPSTGH